MSARTGKTHKIQPSEDSIMVPYIQRLSHAGAISEKLPMAKNDTGFLALFQSDSNVRRWVGDISSSKSFIFVQGTVFNADLVCINEKLRNIYIFQYKIGCIRPNKEWSSLDRQPFLTIKKCLIKNHISPIKRLDSMMRRLAPNRSKTSCNTVQHSTAVARRSDKNAP